MMKRVISLLLVLTMVLSLSACGRVRDLILADLGLLATEEPDVPVIPVDKGLLHDEGKQPNAPSTIKPTTPAGKTEKVALHSGIRADGTFNEGTVFIGDSLTYGLVTNYLKLYDVIGDAKYMAIVGVPLRVFFNGTRLGGDRSVCSPEFSGLTYAKAVEKVGDKATAVYMMLGTNYDPQADAEMYIKVVDAILESCPNATIYLQLIPHSRSSNVHTETVNEHILTAYTHYRNQNCQRVRLIDTRSFVGDEGIGGDGIHMNPMGMDAWYNGILSNARTNHIPE